jgi:hypothetical protein
MVAASGGRVVEGGLAEGVALTATLAVAVWVADGVGVKAGGPSAEQLLPDGPASPRIDG